MDLNWSPQMGVDPKDLELHQMMLLVQDTPSHLHTPQANQFHTSAFGFNAVPNANVSQQYPLATAFVGPYMDIQSDDADIFNEVDFQLDNRVELPSMQHTITIHGDETLTYIFSGQYV
jgi:hypothetical protein